MGAVSRTPKTGTLLTTQPSAWGQLTGQGLLLLHLLARGYTGANAASNAR